MSTVNYQLSIRTVAYAIERKGGIRSMTLKPTHKYDDIIDKPHHVSSRRAAMTMSDRAAQFAPFSALNGYEDVIEESGRLTDLST